jgi:hypothetical protein
VLNIDVTPELWQVLLNHAQPDWVLPPSASNTTAGAASGAVVPWLPQPSSPGREPFSPFTASAGSAGGDGSQAACSGGGASEGGGCGTAGVPIEVFSMTQAYGEWFIQVGLRRRVRTCLQYQRACARCDVRAATIFSRAQNHGRVKSIWEVSVGVLHG